jgi:hypothetical protein
MFENELGNGMGAIRLSGPVELSPRSLDSVSIRLIAIDAEKFVTKI